MAAFIKSGPHQRRSADNGCVFLRAGAFGKLKFQLSRIHLLNLSHPCPLVANLFFDPIVEFTAFAQSKLVMAGGDGVLVFPAGGAGDAIVPAHTLHPPWFVYAVRAQKLFRGWAIGYRSPFDCGWCFWFLRGGCL